MGPETTKKDIYKVMTNSRELANYCQESVKSIQSKKISESLNNFHLDIAKEFLTKTLINNDHSFFDLNEIDFNNPLELTNQTIYNKVINYIENYFIDY